MTHPGQQPEATAASKRRKAWRANLGLLLVSTAAALGIGELVVRLVLKDRVVLFPRFHSAVVYGEYTLRRLRPRTEFWHTSADGSWRFVTNAQGFRDTRDFPYAKQPGRIRVLAIGDSHTQGFEVRQEFTYSAVAERWLRLREIDAEAINAGVSGFSTAEAVAFLENEGIKYQPDVVLFGLHGNDYLDNVRSGLFSLVHDTLVTGRRVYAPATAILDVINDVPPVRWLSQSSYLYSFAVNFLWDRYKALSVAQARRGVAAEYVTQIRGPGSHETALMGALLRRLGEFCRARGILLVIIDVPMPQGSGVGSFASSILPSIRPLVRSYADVALLSDDVLAPYREVAELHVPHGQHHISEFSHTILGIRAGEAIVTAQGACKESQAELVLCAAGGLRHESPR